MLEKAVEPLMDLLPCTACRYCCEGCPKSLDIPELLSIHNELKHNDAPAVRQLLLGGLAWGLIQTGLSEEILFRGFLGKRLIHKFGFITGNITQALLFGLLHGVMFFSAVGLAVAVFITMFSGFIGWGMGYINEKHANGSILPSWLIHGVGNVVVAVCSMFDIL